MLRIVEKYFIYPIMELFRKKFITKPTFVKYNT